MNLKSTILVLALAGGAGVWLWKGDDWTGRSQTAAANNSKSAAALDADFKPEKLTRIELAGDNALVLEKAEGDVGWKLPGNWPLRKQEVAELVDVFANLKSRFVPVSLQENEDLTRFGLGPADKPLVVKATAGGTAYTLAFGEAKPANGDSAFTRPTYLRINDFPELIRLGPDVMPVLRRPADSYRRRQLFPDSERIKIAAASTPFGPGGGSSVVALITDRAKEIEVRTVNKNATLFGVPIPRTESYKLVRTQPFPKPVVVEKGGEAVVQAQRIADAWEFAVPQRDRVDADRLQKILATIPDLWVEEFATDASKAGLDKPERTLTVTQADGSKLVLLVGGVFKSVEREETVSAPPPMPGFPPVPMTRKVKEDYLFAKLADNPQVFVVRAEKLNDLFPSAASLRDPQLMHFESGDVLEATIAAQGRPPVKLVKKDGKWFVDGTLAAESAAVSQMLDQLSGLRSAPGEAKGDPAGTTVTIVSQEKRPDGDPPAEKRTVVVHLGKPKLGPWPAIASATSALVAVGVGANSEGEPIPARVEGWPRITMVDAAVLKAVAPEAGFRDRTLSNFFTADKLILETGGPPTAFSKSGKDWKQTAPKEGEVDSAEIDDLVSAMGRLRADRFVVEKAAPADLKKYGLDSPRAKWTVLAEGKDVLVLLVGAAVDGKAYAKLASGEAIVTLPADVSARLTADYRPKKVWNLDEARVETIEVDYPGVKLRFKRQGTGWEDPGAPKDTISDKAVSELLTALGALKAERWLDGATVKDHPMVTLTLRDGTKRVLHLGAMMGGPEGSFVDMRAGDPGAIPFRLGDPYLKTLKRSRTEYIEKK